MRAVWIRASRTADAPATLLFTLLTSTWSLDISYLTLSSESYYTGNLAAKLGLPLLGDGAGLTRPS
jgi:hypothetical protein